MKNEPGSVSRQEIYICDKPGSAFACRRLSIYGLVAIHPFFSRLLRHGRLRCDKGVLRESRHWDDSLAIYQQYYNYLSLTLTCFFLVKSTVVHQHLRNPPRCTLKFALKLFCSNRHRSATLAVLRCYAMLGGVKCPT